MPPRRRKAAKLPRQPVRVKDKCPHGLVKNNNDKWVSKRIWTDRITPYRDNLSFTGPQPGYKGKCDINSKDVDFFLELFEDAAKFILINTNRHIRRLRNKLMNEVRNNLNCNNRF